MQTVIIGAVGPQGPRGTDGVDIPPRERRSDYSGSFSYCGFADIGTPESASLWTITRITVLDTGNVTTAVAVSSSWTDRYTNIYI
jgi:hypothetical protein